MYSCQEVIAALSDILDGDVPAELRREIEEHLGECRTCTTLYDSTRKTLRIVTDSRSFDLPEAVSDRVLRNLAARADTEKPPGSPRK